MTHETEPTAEALSESDAGSSQPLDWDVAVRAMAEGGSFWLATVRPDSAPHVMPVFAAWAGSTFFIASKDSTRKSRNLDAEPRCVISTETGELHLVIEGVARHVRDAGTLQRAVEAFQDVYEWPTRVANGKIDADYGAPTSGGPPYEVFDVTPTRAFGLPTAGETTPTRWTFRTPSTHE